MHIIRITKGFFLTGGDMQMNRPFTILTDSTSNLPEPYIEKYGIVVLPLKYIVDGEEYPGYSGEGGTYFQKLYEYLRTGSTVTTSMVNSTEAYVVANDVLEMGNDILYIGLSSKLSGTYYAVESALNTLKGEFPEREIYAVDSLCVALGEGALVYEAVKQKKQGKQLSQIYEWCNRSRWNVNTIFTVDDLEYLRRSGRASSAISMVGTILKIKPIIRMSNGGILRQEAKVRGRKKALDEIVKRAVCGMEQEQKQMVFVSHGDCLEDARYVADCLRRCGKATKVIINTLDPVIGVHTGPGSIGIFFTKG